jgi:hypothetical protein
VRARIRILPDGQSPSIVEIWLPDAPPPPPSRLAVSVSAPGGVGGTLPLDEGSGSQPWVENGNVLAQVDYNYEPLRGRSMFRIYVNPTATQIDFTPSLPLAPAGLWSIVLENALLTPQDEVHLWARRAEAPYGYPIRGRQSFFDDPAYQRYDDAGRDIEVDDPGSIVKRYGSINGLATGREPSVIGGAMRKELRPAKYSAAGPITLQAGTQVAYRDGPDAVTVSDDSTVHAGVLAAGTHGSSVLAMNGTSVAAPRVTREVARILSAGGDGSRFAIQALAVPFPPPPPPVQRVGAGYLNLPSVYPLRRFEP